MSDAAIIQFVRHKCSQIIELEFPDWLEDDAATVLSEHFAEELPAPVQRDVLRARPGNARTSRDLMVHQRQIINGGGCHGYREHVYLSRRHI